MNNFNTNSNGADIETICCYSAHESYALFSESIEILQHGTCLAYYIDSGNVPASDSIEFKLKGTDAQKAAWFKMHGETPAQHLTDEEYIIDSYYEQITLLNYREASEAFAPMSIEPSKPIEWVTIRGYSQGDIANVAYCPDDLTSVWGNVPDEASLEAEFTHLFYDAPIYCLITIDGKEYSYSEFMPDVYEWDKAAFVAKVADKSGVPADNIAALLPNEPEYI